MKNPKVGLQVTKNISKDDYIKQLEAQLRSIQGQSVKGASSRTILRSQSEVYVVDGNASLTVRVKIVIFFYNVEKIIAVYMKVSVLESSLTEVARWLFLFLMKSVYLAAGFLYSGHFNDNKHWSCRSKEKNFINETRE